MHCYVAALTQPADSLAQGFIPKTLCRRAEIGCWVVQHFKSGLGITRQDIPAAMPQMFFHRVQNHYGLYPCTQVMPKDLILWVEHPAAGQRRAEQFARKAKWYLGKECGWRQTQLGGQLPFLAAVSLVMGSWSKGAIVLLVALGGLVGLGGFLGLLLWAVVRLLPLDRAPLLNMARGSLRRRGLSPVFALVALFVGVVTLTVSAVVTQNAVSVMDSVTLDFQGPNLTVLAPASQDARVLRALESMPVESLSTGYQTRVRAIALASNPDQTISAVLEARSTSEGYLLSGAEWGSRPGGVYLFAQDEVAQHSSVEITLWDGTRRILPVVGTYQVDFDTQFRPELGVLLPVELSRSVTAPSHARFEVRVPAGRLADSAAALGAALPDAAVINRVAYAARFTSAYHNLFLLAISVTSLALLAGALLMANSVSLSVLDRRYEIGVLKAMGYTRGHVLLTLVVEYAIIALVAGAAGLVCVRAFLWLVGMQQPMAARLRVLTPAASAAVLFGTLGLALLAVLAVVWKPTRVSPLVVLNDRE